MHGTSHKYSIYVWCPLTCGSILLLLFFLHHLPGLVLGFGEELNRLSLVVLRVVFLKIWRKSHRSPSLPLSLTTPMIRSTCPFPPIDYIHVRPRFLQPFTPCLPSSPSLAIYLGQEPPTTHHPLPQSTAKYTKPTPNMPFTSLPVEMQR